MGTTVATGTVQLTDELGENIVKIVKDSVTSYNIVDNETEFIGTFDTTYSISGNSESLISSLSNVISVIQEDFNRSPTIGYIRLENVSTLSPPPSDVSNKHTIPNPFADSAAINQTIRQEISNAIGSVNKLNSSVIEIICDFDMNIAEWNCVESLKLG